MSNFQDHYSKTAREYASFRPTYPDRLFAWLAEVAPRHRLAWDCGCGNGQASRQLASHFASVIATDPSHAQIAHAARNPRVTYAVATAEDSAVRSGTADIVAVAQALHWFQLTRFYDEATRVLAPHGVLAVWTYGLLKIDPAVDVLLHHFHATDVGAYWPPERALVDAGYASIDFPFRELVAPRLWMEAHWSLAQLEGYLGTWSAVTRFTAKHGASPVPQFMESVQRVWGPSDAIRHVTWPLEMRVGVAP